MIRIFCFLLIIFIFSGCSLIPHSYRFVKSDVWQDLAFEEYIYISLPKDNHFSVYRFPKHTIGVSLCEIVPNSIWEPYSFARVKITSGDLIDDGILEHGGKYGEVYKYYVSELDSIYYDCIIKINDTNLIQCELRIVNIKGTGNAYSKHDPLVSEKLDNIYKRILWEIKFKGQRLCQSETPEQIEVQKQVWSDVPKGYESLFAKFGF